MKLAREIAYRHIPFGSRMASSDSGRRRADPSKQPFFMSWLSWLKLIWITLERSFAWEYDANSLLYVSKVVDLFDLGLPIKLQVRLDELHMSSDWSLDRKKISRQHHLAVWHYADSPYEGQPEADAPKDWMLQFNSQVDSPRSHQWIKKN